MALMAARAMPALLEHPSRPRRNGDNARIQHTAPISASPSAAALADHQGNAIKRGYIAGT
ncbi:hypothetical protein [Noviherbaspirillum humi]|uniref:hypothetical protein n=1 Tax=Noviherbaspirillum humi TaxID=1688639 RepID=UPI0011608D62|nr:hypothetical protein [Noviherbaspirillum humi]